MFAFIEALLLFVVVTQFVLPIINLLLWHLHPVFREPLDLILADSSGNRVIPGTIRGVTLVGCALLLFYAWGYVRRRVTTWPYDRMSSPELRAKLGAPSEKPAKPTAGWKAMIFFFFVEFMLAFVVALPVAALVLDPLIGVWSVAFLAIAPFAWFVLRGVVALLRGRGPWPYVEKSNDVVYYLTETLQPERSDDEGSADVPRQ